MKKIGIITVYHTENTGSVLQANALKEFLALSGYDVYFVNTRNKYSAHSKKRLIKKLFKSLKSQVDFKQSLMCYKYYEKYIKTNFKVVNAKDVESIGINQLIIGSDTVWDMNSRYFLESQDLFWGTKWRNIPVISYAASVANSDIEKLINQNYFENAIKKMKAIGVRDGYTRHFAEVFGKENVVMNCDPTMLFELSHYQKKCKLILDKYILLYVFEKPDLHFVKKLKQYAYSNGYKIICLGEYVEECDMWISSTVENFLSYFNSAEIIITNTFHGTVFSIIFNKEFIVLDCNKMKIRAILVKFELENRLTNGELNLLQEKIDYSKVNRILASFRSESQEYLLKALELFS